eukprot:6718756-Prymnesium_polylepis.1
MYVDASKAAASRPRGSRGAAGCVHGFSAILCASRVAGHTILVTQPKRSVQPSVAKDLLIDRNSSV